MARNSFFRRSCSRIVPYSSALSSAIAARLARSAASRDVVRLERPPGRTETQRERAERAAARDERQDDERCDGRAAGNFEGLAVLGFARKAWCVPARVLRSARCARSR